MKLKYDYDAYRPDILANMPYDEIAKEYNRLEKRANRSLNAMSKTKYKNTETYLYNAGKYPDVSNIKSKTELAYRLSDLARFVTRKTSTLSGLREQEKKTIQTLHERGYTFVNSRNYQKFVDFMDTMRTVYKNIQFDSEYVAEVFEEYAIKKKVKVDKLVKDFEKYYEEYKE